MELGSAQGSVLRASEGVQRDGEQRIAMIPGSAVSRRLNGAVTARRKKRDQFEQHYHAGQHHGRGVRGTVEGGDKELSEDERFSCSLLIPPTFPEHLQRVRPCAIQAGN